MGIDISNIPIIDTHEHLRPESERIQFGGDLFATFFSHYTSTDLKLAGLSNQAVDRIRDPGVPLDERWNILKPYWELTKYTAYGLSIRLAIRDLYGIDDLNDTTLLQLFEKMHSLSKRGLYHDVFQRAKIKTAIVQDTDSGIILKPNDPPDLIHQVLRTGELFWIRSKEDMDLVSLSIGYGTVHSLNEWLDVCGLVFERGKAAVGIKLPIAYVSSLKSSRPTFSEAEQVFNRFVRKRELFALGESISWEEATPLRDYLIHQVIRLATKYHLPIQIHTGLLENTYNDVRDSDPLHLIPLFLEYPDARFVLFHGGYPWIYEFAAIGKEFPNVWLDLCWLWIISPKAGRELLHLLIETIPVNKICAFGGDYKFIEGTYGHSVLMRQAVSRVLDEKIQEKWFTESEAMRYANRILYLNASELYSL